MVKVTLWYLRYIDYLTMKITESDYLAVFPLENGQWWRFGSTDIATTGLAETFYFESMAYGRTRTFIHAFIPR